MLVLENLSCGYGPFRAVQSLNLKLEEGSVNALIGANGAGKSSTLMSIAGHVKIQEGKVFVSIIPDIESVNYGRNVGYEIIEHKPPTKIKKVSATKIRQKLRKSGKL